MKRVLLRAPVLTQSGYGVHARQIARWLMAMPNIDLKVQALQWGDTPWLIDGKASDGLLSQLMQRTVDPRRESAPYDVSFQLQLPNEWDPKLARFNVGITAGVETDRSNPAWAAACNKMSEVIVPSVHAEASLRAGGNILAPITVIPESFCDAIAVQQPPSRVELGPEFNFLIFGQITGNNALNDRKNLFNTVKWLSEAFADEPSVGIVLKTNSCRNSLIDRNVTVNVLSSLVAECRRGGKVPQIQLLHGDMSDAEIAALFQHPKIKALVSLTRGEGFGLPLLEAAAAGLPVFATAWSGHTDFLAANAHIPVQYTLGEVHSSRVDDRIFVKGARWANANESDFKRRAKEFRANPEPAVQAAKAGSELLLKSHSHAAIADRYTAKFAGALC